MPTLQPLDYAAIVLYMVMMAGIGIFLGRFVKNINDYFKGGSGVSWIAGGISNFMTKFSTFIFVAYAGIAYEHGLVAITVLWSTIFPSLVAVFYFAKRWKRAGVVSPVEFLETRFNAPIRQLFSWSGVAFKLLDDMIKLYSIGLFVTAATNIPFETTVLGCGLVVVLYTVVGGFWAVIVTDVVQFVILFFATAILLPLSLMAAGGLDNMVATIPRNMTWFNGPKGTPWFLLVYYTLVLIRYSGNWTFIQRFYSAKTETDGQKLGILSAVLFFIFPVIFLFPPIAARVILPNLKNPEMAYVSLCLKLLPSGVMGLMMAAMFAATMSVLSAEYNVTASVLTRDIYQRLLRPNASPKESLWVGRGMTLLVGILVMIGALFVGAFGGAFEANKLLSGLFAVPMVVPVVCGILFYRPKPIGAVATLVIGTAVGFVLNANKALSWETATAIELVVCLLIFWLSGFLPSPGADYDNRVTAFFRKLATPALAVSDTPNQTAIMRAMKQMYGLAFGITGLLFVGMGLPSFGQLSGKLAVVAGILCLGVVAVLLLRKSPNQLEPSNTPEKHTVDL